MLETEALPLYLPRDLTHVHALENNVDRYYCINSTKYLLSFRKNMALYFVTVWHSTNEGTFYLNNIVFLVQKHHAIHNGCCPPIRPI